jgi:MoaA/NifB/PqqE/SkfB family radical SAM enzyme
VSTFEEITIRSWNECRLMSVLLELTHNCNLNCFYCYNDRVDLGAPLSTDEYSVLFEQLADMGVLNLTLTGGEPLVHPDFFVIAGRARELGFVIRLKSNGHLIRGEVARRIVDEVDPYQIDLSLHGATAATHDRQTRHPGSFDRLLANIDEMRRLGLRLRLNCTLTRWNEHEVAELFELTDRLGIHTNFNASVSPKDDGGVFPLQISPTSGGMAELARILDERHQANRPDDLDFAADGGDKASTPEVRRHCGAGSASVTIDQWGNVLPCVQWRRNVGNIRETPFPEMWAKSRALAEVQQITIAAKDSARRFEGPQGVAFFCPGMAELMTGDPLKIYPATPPDFTDS